MSLKARVLALEKRRRQTDVLDVYIATVGYEDLIRLIKRVDALIAETPGDGGSAVSRRLTQDEQVLLRDAIRKMVESWREEARDTDGAQLAGHKIDETKLG